MRRRNQRRWGWAGMAALMLASAGGGAAGTLAQFRTAFGDIDVELYDQDKPVTVANFIRYVQAGRWEDMFAHRLVPGFVVQGGGFQVVERGTANPSIAPVSVWGTIPNEFGEGRRLSNVYGTIAMAKVAGDTNSASSQWFFNLANNTFLDAADSNNFFTVFGRVVRGTNVLEVFNRFVNYAGPATRPTNVVMNFGIPLNQLPLLRTNAAYSDLVYVDVTLLGVEVAERGGVKDISWNSVAGLTNRVEFTRGRPSGWETLVATNGTGGRMTTSDAGGGEWFRFYRVRVEY